eukprot:5729288-Lingulodinium_polyedra.AAC.1
MGATIWRNAPGLSGARSIGTGAPLSAVVVRGGRGGGTIGAGSALGFLGAAGRGSAHWPQTF